MFFKQKTMHIINRYTCKIIYIAYPEISWVKNVLRLIKHDNNSLNYCLKWKHGTPLPSLILNDPLIVASGHTSGTFTWTLSLVQKALKNNSKVLYHKHGLKYNLFD